MDDRPSPAGILDVNRFVPRGWFFRGHYISEVGPVTWDGDDCYAPVRYTCGEYAVVKMSAKMKMNGITVFYLREIAPRGQSCVQTIRHSSSMPEILSIEPDRYVIGVTEAATDLKVTISRSPDGDDTIAYM